jgi:hypothetical protein
VIFASTADPTFNITEPGGAYAGSGWQFQGAWNGFLATPIAPNFFISANHIGGAVGGSFQFQGTSYLADATYPIPGTDLRLWRVTTTFPAYAPLYRADDEVGKELIVFGTGTQRGEEVLVAGQLHGWRWGPGDGVRRWGTNIVSSTVQNSSGSLLRMAFDEGASPNEAHLSVGDSSGGVFIKDTDGIWKLAGVNFAVDGPYYPSLLGGDSFNAALFDQSGLFTRELGVFLPAFGPSAFYASRISANLDAIDAIITAPEPGSVATFGCGTALLASARRRRPPAT